jgi:hypothetical protein
MWKSFKEFISLDYNQWWVLGLLWAVVGFMIHENDLLFSGMILMVISHAWESIEQKIDDHKP